MVATTPASVVSETSSETIHPALAIATITAIAARGSRADRSEVAGVSPAGISQHTHPATNTMTSGSDTVGWTTGGPINALAAAVSRPDAAAAATTYTAAWTVSVTRCARVAVHAASTASSDHNAVASRNPSADPASTRITPSDE
jgi:hypothetical protein